LDINAEIYINKIVISFNGETRTFTSRKPFSSVRLLVGDFVEAHRCLRQALKEMNVFSIFNFRNPKLRIHPKELLEGGLSEIEKRVLLEMGYGAGAKKVDVVVNGKAV